MSAALRAVASAVALFLSWPALAADPGYACLDSLERDIGACDSAIAEEKHPQVKARLFYHRGWANNQAGRTQAALKDLDVALTLFPDYQEALQERAYTFAELTDFHRAMADVERALKLQPDDRIALAERAFVHSRTGEFGKAYADIDRLAKLSPKDAGALLDRAEAALWIQRFDDAAADVDRALALLEKPRDEAGLERARSVAEAVRLWRTPSGIGSPARRCDEAMRSGKVDQPNLIGDCTAAFFTARKPADKGLYLTVRSLAWAVGRQDEERFRIDAEAAVAVDPGNPDWRVNLGGAYNRLERYPDALREFDRALAAKESFAGLAGRASARYELGDKNGAFSDARRSFEIRPNEIALIVLGDLSRDRGDRPSAKLYWMGAYHLGSRDDGTIARLRSVGIDRPDQEAAKP